VLHLPVHFAVALSEQPRLVKLHCGGWLRDSLPSIKRQHLTTNDLTGHSPYPGCVWQA
jgi:hypothetical protein